MSETEDLVARTAETPTPSASKAYIAIGSACCLSIGHHYGNFLLGPLKREILERLHGSELDFATLVSSFALVNTLTPLIGYVIPRWGLPLCALLAASSVLFGQVIILSGSYYANVYLMVAGYFIGGIGSSPLAVVQETIILRCTRVNQRGRGVAAALFLGKLATWVGSITASPLSHSPLLGPSTPFLISSLLSLFSLLAAVAFSVTFPQLTDHDWLPKESRIIPLTAVITFGDAFWIYIALCAASGGLWSPFIHLSTDLLATLYSSTSGQAAIFASLALFTCLFLYPLYGVLIDSKFQLPWLKARKLLPFCTTCTLISLLILESSSLRYWLGMGGSILGFAIGRGLAPLLLVMVVPDIVESEMLSTALGIHKSIENAASTLVQLASSFILEGGVDKRFQKPPSEDPERRGRAENTVLLFLCVNMMEVVLAWILSHMEPVGSNGRDSYDHSTEPLLSHNHDDSHHVLLLRASRESLDRHSEVMERSPPQREHRPRRWRRQGMLKKENIIRRGKIGLACSSTLILSSWVTFIAALLRRRS